MASSVTRLSANRPFAETSSDATPALRVAATEAPVLVVPAMNDRMWSHLQTQKNVAHLRDLGYHVLPPDSGELAVGEGHGPGRMPEPETILAHAGRLVDDTKGLRGRRVVVSAGPTREAVDPVRFLSNRSSGKMGVAIAASAWRRGADVVLVDAFGAGHSRSSSGGDTRVIRGMYGPNAVYMDWVLRSFELWRQAEAEWGVKLYTPTGALWMFRGDDGYARESLPLMAERNLPVDELPVEDARRRFPRIDFDGVQTVYLEHRAGFLAARDSCRLHYGSCRKPPTPSSASTFRTARSCRRSPIR